MKSQAFLSKILSKLYLLHVESYGKYCSNLQAIGKIRFAVDMLFFQVKERIDLAQSKKKELEDTYRVKKRTIDLLPDAENNIVKLEVSQLTFFSPI